MQDLKTPQDTLKNLQQQYILVEQISDIYTFLNKQIDGSLPSAMPDPRFDSYNLSSAIKMLSDFTSGVEAAESQMNFSGVVDKLEETRRLMEDEYNKAKQLSDKADKEKEAAEEEKIRIYKIC